MNKPTCFYGEIRKISIQTHSTVTKNSKYTVKDLIRVHCSVCMEVQDELGLPYLHIP